MNLYTDKKRMKEENFTRMKNPQNAEEKRRVFSMHTMTVRARLTKYDKDNICEKLAYYSKSCKKGYYQEELSRERKIKYKKFRIADRFGFNSLYVIQTRLMEEKVYWLEIKMNPRKMFHADDYPFTYIASEEDIRLSGERIQSFLDETGITEIDKSSFYICRIDYCVNIDLQTNYAANEYMRLMRKGRYPYRTNRMLEYSMSRKRYVPTPNAFTLYSDTCEFSIYNKKVQLEDAGKYTEEEIQKAEGMIRIEYRAKRRKVRYEERKSDCESGLELLEFTPEIAEKNISRYLKLAYGSGRFVKYAEAKCMIEESGFQRKTKKVLIDILKIVSRYDLQTAQLYYGKDFGKHMKQFNKLGISPITIERDAGIEEFPNPLYYIKYRNKNSIEK